MSYLYAVRMLIPNHFHPIKIGFSVEPERRVKEFTRGPFPTRLLGTWKAPNGLADECRIHQRFKQHRLNGEWFYPASDLLSFLSAQGVDPNRTSDDVPGPSACIPDPFDGLDSYLFTFLRRLEEVWPRVGGRFCFLKTKDLAALLGMPAQRIRDSQIIPCKFGGAVRYAYPLVRSYFTDKPEAVERAGLGLGN